MSENCIINFLIREGKGKGKSKGKAEGEGKGKGKGKHRGPNCRITGFTGKSKARF